MRLESHETRVLADARMATRWQRAQRNDAEPVHGSIRGDAYPCGLPASADVLGGVVMEHVTCPGCLRAMRGGG